MSTTPDPHTSSRPASIAGSPSIEEFLADLLWPRLFRAAGLSMRFSRIAIALLTIVLIGVVGSISLLWSDHSLPSALWAVLSPHFFGLLESAAALDADGLARSARRLAFEAPVELLDNHLWTVLTIGPCALIVFAAGTGAICRSVACEFSQGVRLRTAEALGFGIARVKSLVGAHVAPPLLAGVLAAGIAVVSWLLLGFPYVNIVGAAAYPAAIAVSAACVVLLIGYLFAGPMLSPAVACEGTDAVDAIQRAYAYTIGRPGRLILYVILLIAQGVLAIGAFSLLAGLLIDFAAWSSSALLAPKQAAVITGEVPQGEQGYVVAARVIEWWGRCVRLFVVGYGLSYFSSAGTVLYLLLRRLCDGQDVEELWMPGMIPGTMASVVPPVAADPDESDD